MGVIERTKASINRGRSNNVNFIPTGISKLDYHTDGLTQGTYILVGAETTVGKTSFVRDKYIHSVYEYYKIINDPARLDVLFVDMSLEITPEINMAGAISRKAFMDYQKVLPAKRILKGLSDEDKPLVDDLIDNYFTEFQSKCINFEEDIAPGKYHDILMAIAKQNGRFTNDATFISDCGLYIPNNPNLYVIVLLDTINLTDLDSGHTSTKSTIDRISRISVWFRNKCNFIFVIIQQFNADLSSVERRRFGVSTPKVTDLEDSKRTSKDCDIALGLYDPMRHLPEEEKMFRGYNIEILRSWYRSLHIMKNRRGENNKVIDLKFDGAMGIFSQLPDAKDMDNVAYLLATKH